MKDTERRQTVRRMARKSDPDRYLSALFAPRNVRDDLLALYAFNAEIARIPDEVSEPTLGEIRLQWWRDAMVVAVAGEVTGHPVADALGASLRRFGLKPTRLDRLINGRRFDVIERMMPDAESLVAYLDDTAGELFMLAAEFILAAQERDLASSVSPANQLRALARTYANPGKEAKHAKDAAMAAGRAYGLTGLMRALAMHMRREQLFLPVTGLQSGAAERVLQGKNDPAFLGLLAEMRRRARAELIEAEALVHPLAPELQAAFQPLSLVAPYLKALAKLPNPLSEIADINPVYRLWRLATWRA